MSREHKTSLKWCLKPFVKNKKQSTGLRFDQNCFVFVCVCVWSGLIRTYLWSILWSGSLFTSSRCCDLMWPLETRALKYTTVIHTFFFVSNLSLYFLTSTPSSYMWWTSGPHVYVNHLSFIKTLLQKAGHKSGKIQAVIPEMKKKHYKK